MNTDAIIYEIIFRISIASETLASRRALEAVLRTADCERGKQK